MSDQKIRTELNDLPIQGLIDCQWTNGRFNIEPKLKEFWKEKHDYAIELLADERRGRLVRHMATLLREITYSIHAMQIDPFLTFYPYTDVAIIDWFIGRTHSPFSVLKSRALRGIYCLLYDLLQFEAASLTGFETRHRKKLVNTVVHKRIDKIEEAVIAYGNLFELVEGKHPDYLPESVQGLYYNTLEQYTTEPSRLSALIHFSCFPQSEYHDEVLFLRTIHISELCFFGLRTTLMETIENLRHQRLDIAAKCINEATAFGEMLHRVFGVLRTMPVEHFTDFRDYTDRASAVQSRGYQLFDAYFLGVDQRKLRIYKEVYHLSDLEKFAHPSFVSLKSLLPEDEADFSEDWKKVMEAAHRLDSKLKSWRGMHLGFAKLYLPPAAEGTGGTVGAPYLEQFLHKGLFSETTIDEKILEEMFPEIPGLPSQCRVPTGHRLAPKEELRSSAGAPNKDKNVAA